MFLSPIQIVVECPVLEDPENGRMNCSHPEPVYSAQCSFKCNPEYSLDGHELLTCDGHGNWTEERPICRGKTNKGTDEEKYKYNTKFESMFEFKRSNNSLLVIFPQLLHL